MVLVLGIQILIFIYLAISLFDMKDRISAMEIQVINLNTKLKELITCINETDDKLQDYYGIKNTLCHLQNSINIFTQEIKSRNEKEKKDKDKEKEKRVKSLKAAFGGKNEDE